MDKSNKNSKGVTPELMMKYLRGELSEDEQHQLERHMLDDDFDNDALEGFASNQESMQSDLAQLNRRLEQRIAEEKSDPKFLWFKIAASIVIAALSSYLIWDLVSTVPNEALTYMPEKELQEEPKLENEAVRKNTEVNEVIVKKDKSIILDSPTTASSQEPEPKPVIPIEVPDEEALSEMVIAESDEELASESVWSGQEAAADGFEESSPVATSAPKPILDEIGNVKGEMTVRTAKRGNRMMIAEKAIIDTSLEAEEPIIKAQPTMNRETYKAIISDKLTNPPPTDWADSVIVTFDVNVSGELENITVVSNVPTAQKAEVISVMKTSSSWVPTTKNGIAIADSTRYVIYYKKR